MIWHYYQLRWRRGALWLNKLIDLGQDQELSHALIKAAQEYGAKRIIKMLFGSDIAYNSDTFIQNAMHIEYTIANSNEDNSINLAGET